VAVEVGVAVAVDVVLVDVVVMVAVHVIPEGLEGLFFLQEKRSVARARTKARKIIADFFIIPSLNMVDTDNYIGKNGESQCYSSLCKFWSKGPSS